MDRTEPHSLTIRELVEEAGLGLDVVGGIEAVEKPIQALYIGDLEDPTPWMVRGSLLLTTGPMLTETLSAGPHLVQVLSEADMSGVGVAILPHVEEIPTPMIETADRLALPLLRIPPQTPFRDIASYVHDALSSRDLHGLRRSLALQNQLVEASSLAGGVEALTDRLGALLGIDVFLISAAGETVACHLHRIDESTANDVAARAWQTFRRLGISGGRRSVSSGGPERFHFREVKVGGQLHQVLAAALPLIAVSSDYMEAGLTFSQHLLELAITADRTIEGMRRRTRAGLLDMILSGRGGESELEERLLRHGMTAGESLRIAVIDDVSVDAEERLPDGSGRSGVDQESLAAAAESSLEDASVPFLSVIKEVGVVLLSPFAGPDADDGPQGHLERLTQHVQAAQGPSCGVGVSAPLTSLTDARRGLVQALLACRTSPDGGSQPVLFEDLGVAYATVDQLPDGMLRNLADGVANRLAEIDIRDGTELRATLQHYLEQGRSVTRTASQLFLHRNTLRARLERIERLLDLDLKSTDGLIEARLGMLAARLLAVRAETLGEPVSQDPTASSG